ncbi:ferredoxin--NADP reductase [Roseivirga sp. E12]|uniref:ferredoxin--NADP reductase n=1 Tax=Roseivirga sp. E12 TaxID=2819237 RepID=UPI001ABCE382|nr:ferredoxin--NADP reductase [Roseivirga sp. E12]MBO3700224.1 ferredoxin--NADP reductase [Roseivirga sp. E12]
MAFGLFKKKENKVPEVKTGFLNLKVKEVIRETEDAVSIHFEQPEDGTLSYKSGQFLTVVANVNGKEERRAYSLCSSPFVDAYPAVAVKRVEGGIVSNYLNDSVSAGDIVKLMEPNGNFTTEFTSSNERHVVLFGGGSGITPLMSIAKSTLDQEPNSKVTLVYANRNKESIIFNEAIKEMSADDRFDVIHVLEAVTSEFECHEGYLSQDIIGDVLKSIEIGKAEIFICGPTPMMDLTLSSLSSLGIPDSQVRKESFVSAAATKEENVNDGELVAREVTIIYDGDEYKYTVEPNETILEKGLDEDVDLPFSCQSGLCTACRGKCLTGKVKMDEDEGLSEAEINEGYVLPCVSHPLTDDVVIEIG